LAAVACGSREGEEPTASARQKLATLTLGANVNITRRALNQSEESITVDPTTPNRVFAGTNTSTDAAVTGIFGAFSTDGGVSWSSSSSSGDTSPNDFIIGDGNDTLTGSAGDPTAAFDQFGNLFYGYINSDLATVAIIMSTDGGATFSNLAVLGTGTNPLDADQPTVTTGPGQGGTDGSLWITYTNLGTIVVQGATVTGLGSANVGAFSAITPVPVGQFGDIAVGPNGQVMMAGETSTSSESGGTISVATDPDGLGPQPFGAAVTFATDVGRFDSITPQQSRTVDAEPGVAFDRSSGPHRGRAYLVYTIENPDESNDTDIVLRFSDDDGATWSSELRVNDDTTTNAQFLPRVAIDNTTGAVAVSWHDARNDDGLNGAGDTDGIPNNNAQYFMAVSVDGGVTFAPNVQVSAGTSDQFGDDPPSACCNDIDYGDYSGLAFQSGIAHPAWADNSNSTGDNPAGALSTFDVYTSSVTVSTNQAPVAQCHDVLVPAGAACTAVVNSSAVNNGSFDPDPGDGPPNCTLAPTGVFALGATPVTLTCTDPHGASAQCNATVTVVDNTPPTIACPVSVNVPCTNASGAVATFTTTRADNCSAGTPTCTRASGSTFPLGSTTDTCTVLDGSGNAASCSFNVTVALGDNSVCCPAGTHVILGTPNNDLLNGTPGSDCILGRGSQDTINGNGGNDFISGGDGDDVLSGGAGDDLIFGGTGQDRINGDTGNDTISGGDGDDMCHGNDGNDVVLGGQGQDQLFGDASNDTLIGESGDDHLEGGDGNDLLIGGGAHDTCIGGPGTDTFMTCQNQTQ